MSTFAAPDVTTNQERELEQVFREHYSMLYRTALGMLRNRADAEDVPQTIFLRLLRRGLPTDFQQNAKRYLYRAAVNLSLDVLRSQKRRKLTDGVEQLDVAAVDAGATEEIHVCLGQAVAELRPEVVEILMLKYVHGCKEADIAKLLGISRGTIAIKLFRARARLKKRIRDLSGEQE